MQNMKFGYGVWEMRAVFFHEDDYCQLEVLPMEAGEFCRGQMAEIDEFAARHQAAVGFDSIYIRKGSPAPLKELRIRHEQMSDALSFLPAFEQVETGYGPYKEACANTYAVGQHSNFAVFWNVGDEGWVDAVWLGLWVDKENLEIAERMLLALGAIAPLLLADWNWGICTDLASVEAVRCYLGQKIQE